MYLFCFWRNSPQWAIASSFTRFLDQTQRRTTVGRTPLDEWSARRRDLYLITNNTHNRQTSIPSVGFEPAISAGDRRRPNPYTSRPLGPALITCGKLYYNLVPPEAKVLLSNWIMFFHKLQVMDQRGYYTCWSWKDTDMTLFLIKLRQLTVDETYMPWTPKHNNFPPLLTLE